MRVQPSTGVIPFAPANYFTTFVHSTNPIRHPPYAATKNVYLAVALAEMEGERRVVLGSWE